MTVYNRKTISLCQQVEKTGVSWISVHGRTKQQKCEPVNYEAIKLVRENVAIPVIANGDIRSMRDVQRVHEETGVKGERSQRLFVRSFLYPKVKERF